MANTKMVTSEMVKDFIEKSKKVSDRPGFRFLFFDTFPVSYVVPAEMFNFFHKVAEKFYVKGANGYNGIMAEINDRIEIARRTGKDMVVNDFLKHNDQLTDFFDPSIGKAFEKKTGCGDWLIDKNATTLEKALAIYRKKRRLLRWDYDFDPVNADMCGKKSVKKTLSDTEKAVLQERGKVKNNGEKVVNKQYSVHIHIETTYKRFFDYLATYPAGIGTFFKLSTRSEEAENGTYVWQLQTIKNSRKKIEFLEHFNTWEETGLTLAEYKAQQENDNE